MTVWIVWCFGAGALCQFAASIFRLLLGGSN